MPIKSEYPPIPLPERPYHEDWLHSIWTHAQKDPNRLAIINANNPTDSITFQDLLFFSHSVATFLRSRDFRKGDVVCGVLCNNWEFLVSFAASAILGGAFSGTSYLFTDYELERQFRDSKCKVVITLDTSLERVLKAVRKCPLVQTILVVRENKTGAKKTEFPFGVVDFDEAIATPPAFNQPKIYFDIGKDLILLPYSSGTTGSPKGVMLTHQNYSTMMRASTAHYAPEFHKRMTPPFDPPNEHALIFLPLYHAYGTGVVTNSLNDGMTVVLLQRFDADLFCRCVQKYKIRLLYLVPPILIFLAKSPLVEKYDLSSLEVLLSAAAPAGRDVCEAVKRRHPNVKVISQGYGMTEMTLASHLHHFDGPPGNVGKLMGGMEIKIVDVTTGKELPAGKRGEICVKGPTVFRGYLHRPEATAETLQADGFLHTGDIGTVNEKGFLFILDRKKELIKVKGLQVAPAELEDLLLSHPSVADVAVIGVNDEKAGELPKAFIVRRDPNLKAEEVQKFIKDRVAKYKWLVGGVEFISEIPKSPSGKILRRLLRDKQSKL